MLSDRAGADCWSPPLGACCSQPAPTSANSPLSCSLGLFVLCYVGLGISMYPYIVPRAITIWEAAAPANSQPSCWSARGAGAADPRLYRLGLLGVSRQGERPRRAATIDGVASGREFAAKTPRVVRRAMGDERRGAGGRGVRDPVGAASVTDNVAFALAGTRTMTRAAKTFRDRERQRRSSLGRPPRERPKQPWPPAARSTAVAGRPSAFWRPRSVPRGWARVQTRSYKSCACGSL